MNNIYKISKAQLITAWIFGLILVFALSDNCGWSCSTSDITIGVGVIFLLVFYTFGWRENKKG